jgi:prepilin-type N-terminal cleavage/methylation domain-containing protein
MNRSFNPSSSPRRSRGLSLIEVLVAVVVLAIGMLAIAALQMALTRSSADAKARSQIGAFLQSAMEQQRVAGFADVPVAVDANLVTQVGLAAGVPDLAVDATSTHMVCDQVSCATLGDFVDIGVATGTITANTPQFKIVEWEATWTDATAQPQTLGFTDVVSPLAIRVDTSLVQRPRGGSAGARPVVRTDTPVTAGVIPIAIGDGRETAATNPRPLVVSRDGNLAVAETRYNVLTYQLESGNDVRIQRRVETAAVGCRCQFSTVELDDTFAARAFRPSFWNGERYVVPERADAPPFAGPATLGNRDSQSPLCDQCCRDHHDQPTDEVKFSPLLQNHRHYRLTDGAFVEVTRTSSQVYREACRLVRVDGVFAVTTDMELKHLGLLETDLFAKSPLPSTSAVDIYQNFVTDYLDELVVQERNPEPDPYALAVSLNMHLPELIRITKLATDRRWLHGRGLYLDFLEEPAAERIARAVEDCPDDTADILCALPFIPFTAINSTELGLWSVRRPPDVLRTFDVIQVTNQTTLALGADPQDPVRGRTTPRAEGAEGDRDHAHVNMALSNSGVALAPPISAADAAETLGDLQPFEITEGGAGTGASFQVRAAVEGMTLSQTYAPAIGWLIGGSGDECIPAFSTTNTNPNPYGCNTDSPLNVDVTVLAAGYNRRFAKQEKDPCRNGAGSNITTPYCVYYKANDTVTINGIAQTVTLSTTDTDLFTERTFFSIPLVAPDDSVGISFRFVREERAPHTCEPADQGQGLRAVFRACP